MRGGTFFERRYFFSQEPNFSKRALGSEGLLSWLQILNPLKKPSLVIVKRNRRPANVFREHSLKQDKCFIEGTNLIASVEIQIAFK